MDERWALPAANVAYIGDDWSTCHGAGRACRDGAECRRRMRQRAHWLATPNGGDGAVRG